MKSLSRFLFVLAAFCLPALAAPASRSAAAAPGQTPPPAPKKGPPMQCYHRPAEGFVADVIPFFWKGKFHLFYLCPAPGREGIVWRELVTPDFARMEDWGEVFTNGAKDEQDLDLFTGSVLEREGTFHIFYSGNNNYFAKAGKPGQVVMHATSPDLRHWTKDPALRFPPATAQGYEPGAWRDAFVFHNDEAGEYWMLITARKGSDLPAPRRGCIAVAASPDLKKWTMREPLYAPGLFDSLECPDLFKLGDWWYLVYSTYTGPWATHYRMAKSLGGPWLTPADDLFEAQAFYAAKTAGDGKRRYLCGWLTNRENDKDDGKWKWGGNLLVHELAQRPDGTLAVRAPQAVPAQFTKEIKLAPKVRIGPKPPHGPWQVAKDAFAVKSPGGFAALTLGTMPSPCLIEATLTFKKETANCGLLLRANESLANCYMITLDPGRQCLGFEAWPPPFNATLAMTRPLALKAGTPVKLKIIIDGTMIVIYANDQVALSSRMYDLKEGDWGLFTTGGEAEFSAVTFKTLK